MDLKITPGPWRWHAQGDANDYAMLTSGGRWVIAFRQNGELLLPEQQANAQLMAAAPDLYAACLAQHRGIDQLMALLATVKKEFLPTQHPAFSAVVQGINAMSRARGDTP